MGTSSTPVATDDAAAAVSVSLWEGDAMAACRRPEGDSLLTHRHAHHEYYTTIRDTARQVMCRVCRGCALVIAVIAHLCSRIFAFGATMKSRQF